ncbi:sulfur oxidation c-type cytochrome SoxX [Sinisalibacter aestuarii]|uniref:Cytochrome c domain-containing protein n=1 Tax=Sinisalibacter aestuarii TaxID=2949426 RepID=A0ABQ5LX57_9RHOB|nr:sulfur oxidation c-type cytochrome SoxX [Sinisalibacter aestuarii]GKY89562.1 hypothetical protein STA1M1_34310 [Sinisalibacter aestuarii]
MTEGSVPVARRHGHIRWPGAAIGLFLSGAAAAGAQSLPPLTEVAGDPARGEALLRDMGRASCLICHEISQLDEKDMGEIGPLLDGVAERYDAGELRARVADARTLNPDTMMPPYYSLDGLAGVARAYRGQTIYSAQEVEDVVAFLLTLTDEAAQ